MFCQFSLLFFKTFLKLKICFFLEQLSTEYSWCLPLTYASFDCVGGRKLRPYEVRIIRKDISKALGPTIFVLILGSNNIRLLGKTKNVVFMFRRILEHALKFENVQIVLVSIIPSVVEDTKRRFSELSNILKDLSKNEFRATSTFLNMNSIFAHEGKIEPQYFKSIDIDENNRQRNVHLKFFGACQLARSILDHCTLHVKNKLQY